MREQYQFICLFLLFISGYQTQEPSSTTPPPPTTLPDWYGDPAICTIDRTTTVSPPTTATPEKPLPKFTNHAEFTVELVIKRHRLQAADTSELSLYHYIYDYEKNKLTLFEFKNGTRDVRFYDYEMLKRTTYVRQGSCEASDIPTESDTDGRSAIKLDNGTWHIRPMNEFLLFSNDRPGREIKPVYIGTNVIRGIPVDQWRVCHVDRARYMTELRIWSFAQRGITMPSGIVSELGVPIQALINGSFVYPNNTERLEFDEVFNVLSYQPRLTGSSFQFSPPRGVFCNDVPPQQLVSLKDVGINWPFRFNVRVEALTSDSVDWQKFHLFYHQGDDDSSSRLRYDYLPQGAEDYQSVIHDYTDNLTYIIDRRVGTCKINRGVEIPDIDPLFDPIRFFIKNEASFIMKPPENAWENQGTRPCRTGSMECRILTTFTRNFPPVIDSDTGRPSGETWDTTVQYAWAMRSPTARRFPPNASRRYDYPVSLYLKMSRYTDPNNPIPSNLRTGEVEYEFYEMSHDTNLYQFDTSICYRSLNYDYLHLVFILKLNRGNIIDSNHLNRGQLDRDVHYNLINRMQIRYSRITDLEIDHESVSNDLTVFFTVLGQTPNPGSESGFYDDELTATQVRDILQQVIDDGQFEFEITLRNNSRVQFRGQPGSLKTSKQYISTHSGGKKVVNESYASGSLALAIIVGSFAGLLVGIIIAAVIRIVKKQPMPALPSSISNPLPTINFRSKKANEATSDA